MDPAKQGSKRKKNTDIHEARFSEKEENLLGELQASFAFLSHAERKIAQVLLKDPERFIGCSLRELSALADVSQGSIVNFAGKYAHGGFPHLKLRVAASLGGFREPPFNVVESSDSVKAALTKTDRNLCAALRGTEILNDEATLSRAAERILSAGKVEIYGVFRSALVAADLCYQLLQLGISASYVSDVLTCAVSASMLPGDSLVIAISSSGRTKDILDAVKLAKHGGVPILSITGNKNSPLAALSDEVLVASSSGSSRTGQQSEIRFSQLALCDALCAYLQNILDRNGKKRFFKLETILNSHNVED